MASPAAMASLSVAAPQRRVQMGGPIFAANAPADFRCDEHRVQPVGQGMDLLRRPEDPAGSRALAEPVDVRALGQVGQVAREPGDLAVEDQPGADQDSPSNHPRDSLRQSDLTAAHAGDLQGADQAGALAAGGDVGQVLLGGDRPDGQGHGPRLPTRSRSALPGGAVGPRFRHDGRGGIPCGSLGTSVAVDSRWRMSDPHVTIRDRGDGRVQGAATLLSRMDRDRLSPKEVGS